MAIRKILRMGHPLLNCKAEPVPLSAIDSPETQSLIEDMIDTMKDAEGAGLAAPQIGVSQRVIIFGFGSNQRYPNAKAVPETTLINPKIEPLTDEKVEDWEGCLSIPGLRGRVPRYQLVRYSGYTMDGEKVAVEASGFHARVVQHEFDHLDGILYPQRIVNFEDFGFYEELNER